MVNENSETPRQGALEAYDYDLPEVLIAQEPPARRGESRLLVLDRTTGQRWHRQFAEVTKYLCQGDLLVLNETRVFPARLRARKRTGGRVEILLLEECEGSIQWSALARPARNLRPGEEVEIEPHDLALGARARTVGREGERVLIELCRESKTLSRQEVLELCEAAGETPLPPYIRRSPEMARNPDDRERYQTVYARDMGSAAAPTAGLHFTREILNALRSGGVEIANVTLHVGLGTFQPLTEEAFARPALHAEQVEVSPEAGSKILSARAEGRRIVAVGTTSVRAIESFLTSPEIPFRSRTELFIKPGHKFHGVDALITNFHLPRSSLLVLLCAFAGRKLVLDVYREAVQKGYRFFSYGDAMLVI